MDHNYIAEQHKHNLFYEVFTTRSWRTFMCLRCVHGPECQLRLLSPAALDILIDLDQLMGVCTMFFKRTWDTERMQWNKYITGKSWCWYGLGILRIKRSRVMLAAKKSAFDLVGDS